MLYLNGRAFENLGALVEALLAGQEDSSSLKKQRKSKRQDIPRDMLTMNSFTSKVLDTAMVCESCGASLHWSDARFCYYCGEGT